MYLNFLVKVPDVPGKIVRKSKNGTTYIDLEIGRTYIPEKRYTTVKRSTIGKQSSDDCNLMWPNQNFLKYFPCEELQELSDSAARSACLRVGANIVINKIFDDCKLKSFLEKFFTEKDLGLLQDLMAYSIICENNAGQYYPDYAYNHALRSQNMTIYSDSKVSDFFQSLTDDQRIGFLNAWNESRDHREKIYISYDSTNKNCQAGDLRFVEFGKPKEDKGLPVFNYAIAYDTDNKEPLFYEEYPGSVNDVAQFQYMVEKAYGYGYRKIGFILDRGYFSKNNITCMDEHGYDFIIMMKGMYDLVSGVVRSVRGTFERSRQNSIREFKVYGTTVRRKLFETDPAERFFHIYYSDAKGSMEREALEARIEKLSKYLKRKEFQKTGDFDEVFSRYFNLYFDDDGTFLGAREKTDVIEEELNMCGYFVIVSSQAINAKNALMLYKSRDTSEKLFRGDKSYLGNNSIRVYSDASVSAKIFVEFLALIVRSKIYTCLKDEMVRLDSKPNYMTVPAALKELEKIELVRSVDGSYRMDHAVTATQRIILKAFGIDDAFIKRKALSICEQLTALQSK